MSSITAQPDSTTRLFGKKLWLARLAWAIVVFLVAAVLSELIPVNMRYTYSEWLVTQARPALGDSISYWGFVRYLTVLESIVAAVTILTGLVIFRYKHDDWMGLFVSATLIMLSLLAISSNVDTWTFPRWLKGFLFLTNLLRTVVIGSFLLFFYLFPDGRFTPRWSRWTAGLGLVGIASFTLLPDFQVIRVKRELYADYIWGVFGITMLVSLIISIGAQVHRYRSAGHVKRQQMKWVIIGLGAWFANMLLSLLVGQLLGESWNAFIDVQLDLISLGLIPITIGFAILRYRLWDVDLWINRTVVYGGLTLLVTALYALIVGGTAVLFQPQTRITGIVVAFIIIGLTFPAVYRRWQALVNQFVPMPKPPSSPLVNETPVELPTGTSFDGRILLVARLIWGVVTLFSLVIFVASIQVALATDLFARMPQLAAEIDVALFSVFANNQFLANDALLFISYVQFLLFLCLGLYLFWRKSNDWLTILASVMLISTGAGFSPAVFFLPIFRPEWHIPVSLLQATLFSALLWFLYLFPNGRFVPAWTRFTALFWGIYAIGWLIWPELNPHRAGNFTSLLIFITWAWSGVVAQLYRFRQTDGLERQQQKWVMIGFFLTHLFFGLLVVSSAIGLNQRLLAIAPLPVRFLNALFGLSAILIPVTITLAILHYRLWDLDIWINRAMVYGGLTIVIFTLYGIGVGLLSNLFQTGSSVTLSMLATGLVAILFNPVRQRLQSAVNRLMYGERDDPITALSRLGKRLEETSDPTEILPTLIQTIAHTLKLPYTAIALRDGSDFPIIAEYSQVTPPLSGEAEVIPLVYQSELVGQLLVAPRAPKEPFTLADRRLLENIARQAGTAVHSLQLTADLQRSREHLVAAREEERRRLRRDLHDGLGPQLASLTLKIDAARNHLHQNPDASDQLLLELKEEVKTAIGDIRRVAYNLRPPALDQLGLVSALREHAASQNGHQSLRVDIHAPSPLPPLPAAVEVAAYRIALEAMTNVSRHAKAKNCTVNLTLSDGLHLEINDDGCGLPAVYTAGVGLASMRERVAELGGYFSIETLARGGTTVRANLPFSQMEATDE